LKGKILRYLVVAIGGGLVLAPVIFQMFTRAPLGGQMIDEFRPHMSSEVISRFDGHLDEISAAWSETSGTRKTELSQRLGITNDEFDSRFPQLATFGSRWPAIESEMRGLLDDIGANLDNFEAVASLPPFPLFPWFFVAPGLIVAGAGVWWGRGGDRSAGRWLVVAVGVGLVAAPAVFQMFSRAPAGGQMIEELRPLMTSKKVTAVQLHFLAIGGAEVEIRTGLKPLIQDRLGLSEESFDAEFPASARLVRDWPDMAARMAPMVGAMSDNLDNFQAVDALPPFQLFPWFFVAPGVLLVALGLVGSPLFRRSSSVPEESAAEDREDILEGVASPGSSARTSPETLDRDVIEGVGSTSEPTPFSVHYEVRK
jgi:hypothetical protein